VSQTLQAVAAEITAVLGKISSLEAQVFDLTFERDTLKAQLADEIELVNALQERVVSLNAEKELLLERIAYLEGQIPAPEPTPEPEPEPTPEPEPVEPVIYRDTFEGQRHSSYTNGFAYHPTPSYFSLQKDELGRDVFRLNKPGDGNDDRDEQRFTVASTPRTKLFVGFKRRMAANWFHENMIGPDNWKQLRLFNNNYEHPPLGLVLGFSLIPQIRADGTSTGESKILMEAHTYNENGGSLYPVDNDGPWDIVAKPGEDEMWGFWVELASGPGAKDGRMEFWYNGVDLLQKQMDKLRAEGKPLFVDWHALDLWNYYPGAENFFSTGFFPGWDNAGTTKPTHLDYTEFVIADQRIAEFITPR
jgi:hypothetical protein